MAHILLYQLFHNPIEYHYILLERLLHYEINSFLYEDDNTLHLHKCVLYNQCQEFPIFLWQNREFFEMT